MVFADSGSLGSLGRGCRDPQGKFIPVPQCLPHPYRKKLSGGLSNGVRVLPYEQYTPMAPDPGSYQQIWDFLWSSCVSMAGEDACTRLLGRTPFVCPVDQPRKSFWVPLLVGVAIGKLIL